MNQLGIKTIVRRVRVAPIPRLLGLCQRMRELSSGVIAWSKEDVTVDASMRTPPHQPSPLPIWIWALSLEEQFTATKGSCRPLLAKSGALIKDDHVS